VLSGLQQRCKVAMLIVRCVLAFTGAERCVPVS
jgi:hypothetical protein